MPNHSNNRNGKRSGQKPTHYHWHVYAASGEIITTCEIKGGRDKAKRARRDIGHAGWRDFGGMSPIIPGPYQPSPSVID